MTLPIQKISALFLSLSLLLGQDPYISAPHSVVPKAAALQVQSYCKPIIDHVGQEYKREIELELDSIIALALRDGPHPAQDIDAEMDIWCAKSPEHEGRRFLSLVNDPRRDGGHLVLECGLIRGPEKDRIFRVTTNARNAAELASPGITVDVEPIEPSGTRPAGKRLPSLEEVLPEQ